MAAQPRNAAVPATLRPKGVAPVAATPAPARERRRVDLAIVVPDIRAKNLLINRSYMVGPSDLSLDVYAHIFVEEPGHKGKKLDGFLRWALVDTGLMLPEEVGLIVPIQIEVGWADHEAGS